MFKYHYLVSVERGSPAVSLLLSSRYPHTEAVDTTRDGRFFGVKLIGLASPWPWFPFITSGASETILNREKYVTVKMMDKRKIVTPAGQSAYLQ